MVETPSEGGGSSHWEEVAEPWFWPEELEAIVRLFGPDVSEAPPASRPWHVQVSSDKGVQLGDERGERRAEMVDAGPQSGSAETPSS